MIVLPLDIFATIAHFIPYIDLKQFIFLNKPIYHNPLIRKQIFRLRLEKSVNCRTFMPTEVAKQKQDELKARIQPQTATMMLADQAYRYYLSTLVNLENFIVTSLIVYSDNYFSLKCIIGFHTRFTDADLLVKQAKELYPYDNVKKDQITRFVDYPSYSKIQITYVTVPEKYVTLEQVRADLISYYHVLKKHSLII